MPEPIDTAALREKIETASKGSDHYWVWYGEGDDGNLAWFVGPEGEMRDYRDDCQGLAYEEDERVGTDFFMLPLDTARAMLDSVLPLCAEVEALRKTIADAWAEDSTSAKDEGLRLHEMVASYVCQLSQARRERDEEKARADENFASYTRVRQKYSDAENRFNDWCATLTASEEEVARVLEDVRRERDEARAKLKESDAIIIELTDSRNDIKMQAAEARAQVAKLTEEREARDSAWETQYEDAKREIVALTEERDDHAAAIVQLVAERDEARRERAALEKVRAAAAKYATFADAAGLAELNKALDLVSLGGPHDPS